MYTYKYPRPALTVDVVAFTIRANSLSVLLIQRAGEPYQGSWALPGGFVNIDEELETAASRELEEETGVKGAYLEQLYTYGQPQRDPRGRVVTVAYFTLITADTSVRTGGSSDAAQAQWVPIDNLPELAFDHAEIIEYGLKRLRHKLESSAVGFQLLPELFTLSEIQCLYEIILGNQLDKNSLLRRLLETRLIEKTTETIIIKGQQTPLYRFREAAIEEIKAHRLYP
ncbi:MAG: NUDIX hydrolase [Anaerolineales bacterium]|nr:NUDIX hydrolase [Anaerolineales bacterium]